jgi:hypothetical protein
MTDNYVTILQYRAVWIADDGHTVKGNLTDIQDAIHQVRFLNKYRTAWLEDETGTRVEHENNDTQ